MSDTSRIKMNIYEIETHKVSDKQTNYSVTSTEKINKICQSSLISTTDLFPTNIFSYLDEMVSVLSFEKQELESSELYSGISLYTTAYKYSYREC